MFQSCLFIFTLQESSSSHWGIQTFRKSHFCENQSFFLAVSGRQASLILLAKAYPPGPFRNSLEPVVLSCAIVLSFCVWTTRLAGGVRPYLYYTKSHNHISGAEVRTSNNNGKIQKQRINIFGAVFSSKRTVLYRRCFSFEFLRRQTSPWGILQVLAISRKTATAVPNWTQIKLTRLWRLLLQQTLFAVKALSWKITKTETFRLRTITHFRPRPTQGRSCDKPSFLTTTK